MLSEARLIIDDSPVLPLTELHARAQKLEEKQDVDHIEAAEVTN